MRIPPTYPRILLVLSLAAVIGSLPAPPGAAQDASPGFSLEELVLPAHQEDPEDQEAAGIVRRDHYTLQYNEAFEQAEWVAYVLTREEVRGSTSRRDTFKEDPAVDTGSAALSDYRGSGYDRGHLAPAADMKMSPQSMADSFYMSNMSPQVPGLNRYIWAELEACVRTWAVENESVLVVTGPVLNQTGYPRIGDNKVAVPEYYYKAVLDYQLPERKAIAFILPNSEEAKDRPLASYAVSIDTLEDFTGLDFYPRLPDKQENLLERRFNIDLWPMEKYRPPRSSSAETSSRDAGTANPSGDREPPPASEGSPWYWISGSGTRHNPSCRYYGSTSAGHWTSDPDEGRPCGLCGG